MRALAVAAQAMDRTSAYSNMCITLIDTVYNSGFYQCVISGLILAVLALAIMHPFGRDNDSRTRAVGRSSHIVLLFITLAFMATLRSFSNLHDPRLFAVTFTYLSSILAMIVLGFRSMLTLDKRLSNEAKWRNRLDLYGNSLQLWFLLTFVSGIFYLWQYARPPIVTFIYIDFTYLIVAWVTFIVYCTINLRYDRQAAFRFECLRLDQYLHEVNAGIIQDSKADAKQLQEVIHKDSLQASLEAARIRSSDPPISDLDETPATVLPDSSQDDIATIPSTATAEFPLNDSPMDPSQHGQEHVQNQDPYPIVVSQEKALNLAQPYPRPKAMADTPHVPHNPEVKPQPELDEEAALRLYSSEFPLSGPTSTRPPQYELDDNTNYYNLLEDLLAQHSIRKRQEELRVQKLQSEALPAFKLLLINLETESLKIGPLAAEEKYRFEVKRMITAAEEWRSNGQSKTFVRFAGHLSARFCAYARQRGVDDAEILYGRVHQVLNPESASILKHLRERETAEKAAREAEEYARIMRVKKQFEPVLQELSKLASEQLVELTAIYVAEYGEAKTQKEYEAEINRCFGAGNAHLCWDKVASLNAQRRAVEEAEEQAEKQAEIAHIYEYGWAHGFEATKEKFLERPLALGEDSKLFWKKLEEDLLDKMADLLQTNPSDKRAVYDKIQLDMFTEAVLRRFDREWGLTHQERLDEVLKHSHPFLMAKYGKLLERIGEDAQACFGRLCKEMLRPCFEDWDHLLMIRFIVLYKVGMYDSEELDRYLQQERKHHILVPMACDRVGLCETEFWDIIREQCEETHRKLGPKLDI